MNVEALEFRPARPPLRSLWATAFLAAIALVLAPRIVANPSPEPLGGLAGLALLIAGGLWLWFRGRFPGDPVLRVDAKGMTYTRGGRQRGLKWTQVAEIRVDFTLDRMLFVPTSNEKPIVMHLNMVAADGRRWDMLIEEYWQPPKKKARRTSGS